MITAGMPAMQVHLPRKSVPKNQTHGGCMICMVVYQNGVWTIIIMLMKINQHKHRFTTLQMYLFIAEAVGSLKAIQLAHQHGVILWGQKKVME